LSVSIDNNFEFCRLLLSTPERGTLGKHFSQHAASTLALQLLTIGQLDQICQVENRKYERVILTLFDRSNEPWAAFSSSSPQILTGFYRQ
jgi:hypothetical protein